MAESRTELLNFVAEEVNKYKGIYYPVRASIPEQMFVRRISVDKLHPNPDDEFCRPEVGPAMDILSAYEKEFREKIARGIDALNEPLIVQKIHPDGYMILNGHHRWAALRSSGIKKAPVTVVNLTMETDIQKALGDSERTKRVAFDLDEVVFSSESGFFEDKPKKFGNRHFKEQIRLGVPALFRFFNLQGYDVWVFSSEYYSIDYVHELFKRYSVEVDGIITGRKRKIADAEGKRAEIKKLFEKKYEETVTVNADSVVRILKNTGDFEETEIGDTGGAWSNRVIDIVSTRFK